jgi:cell division topological specificity factor
MRFRGRSYMAFVVTPEVPISDCLSEFDGWIRNSAGYFVGWLCTPAQLRSGRARTVADPARIRAARHQPVRSVAVLRREILTVISRHVAVDPDKVQVTIDRGSAVSTLAVDIEFPNTAGAGIAVRA